MPLRLRFRQTLRAVLWFCTFGRYYLPMDLTEMVILLRKRAARPPLTIRAYGERGEPLFEAGSSRTPFAQDRTR